MPRVTWLPRVLRSAGLEVIETEGWAGRGKDRLNLLGLVVHHTATGPKTSDETVARLLRVGRPDLKGPLSQLGLDRRGRLWMIADGRCSHNGYGLWANDAIGIEAFNDGVGERWPAVQIDAYQRACAAICLHQGWSVDHVKGHRETDKRKPDPTGIDLSAFRARVGAVMAAAKPASASTKLELTMGQYEEIMETLGAIRADIWITKAQLDQVSEAVYGSNDENRDQSIVWNTRYLRGELLGGANLDRVRRILKRFGEPDAAVKG